MKRILLVLLGSFIALNAAKIVPIGPLVGDTGLVFKEGKMGVIIKNVSTNKNHAYNSDDKLNDLKHRQMKLNVTKTVFRYGLGNNFDIRAIVPYIYKKSLMRKVNSLKVYKNTNKGLGDIPLILRYELLSQKRKDDIFLSFGAGVKFPTANTNKKQILVNKVAVNPIMQLGSGSYDYLFEVGSTKIFSRSRIDAHILYKLTSKGDNNYEFGNRLNWDMAYTYALNKKFDFELGLNGTHSQKNKQNTKKVDFSGGNFIYITPALHYKISKGLNLSAGYSYMIKRDNNYDYGSNTGGLSEDGKLIAKLRYIF